MSLLNLNKIAGAATAAAGAQGYETVYWFRSLGQTNVKGVITPLYDAPLPLQAKIQSLSADAARALEDVAQSSRRRNFYFDNPGVAPLARESGRGGDILYARGLWWSVDELPEDFTGQGWVRVGATIIPKPPVGLAAPEGPDHA